MKSIKTISLLSIMFFLISPLCGAEKNKLSDMEKLGKKLFFDENLSNPSGQSCATCHGPEAG